MQMRLWVAVLVPVVGALRLQAAATQPAESPPLTGYAAQIRQILDGLPVEGQYDLSEIVSLKVEQGHLRATIGPIARRATGNHRVQINGMPGDWAFSISGQQRGPRAPSYLALYRLDFDKVAGGGLWTVTINVQEVAGVIAVVGIEGMIGTDPDRAIFLSESQGPAAEIQLTLIERGQIRMQTRAASLDKLRAAAPNEVRQFIRPMLKFATGRDPLAVKAADVYRAFAQIPPDPQVQAAVEGLLPELDALTPERRDKANAALVALGSPAVLVALRLDRARLTPEQKARLTAFVSAHDDSRIADPTQARRDPAFLVACLETDDPAVLRAAKEALGELMGESVEFDIAASPQARATAADRIWSSIMRVSTTQPTTRSDK